MPPGILGLQAGEEVKGQIVEEEGQLCYASLIAKAHRPSALDKIA